MTQPVSNISKTLQIFTYVETLSLEPSMRHSWRLNFPENINTLLNFKRWLSSYSSSSASFLGVSGSVDFSIVNIMVEYACMRTATRRLSLVQKWSEKESDSIAQAAQAEVAGWRAKWHTPTERTLLIPSIFGSSTLSTDVPALRYRPSRRHRRQQEEDITTQRVVVQLITDGAAMAY